MMGRDRKIGIAIILLCLILTMVLMFCLENGMTVTFWIAIAFVIAAFVSSLVFQLGISKKSADTDEKFLHLPPAIISSVYMILQIPVGVVFSIGSNAIPVKWTILVNAIIMIVAWILALVGLAGNDHIRKINDRQKNHHTIL